MLKFLLILFLVFYLFIKVGGFIMKTLFSGFSNQQQGTGRNQNTQTKRPADGNVNIEYIPNSNKSNPTKKDFKGGDYVDYEEV